MYTLAKIKAEKGVIFEKKSFYSLSLSLSKLGDDNDDKGVQGGCGNGKPGVLLPPFTEGPIPNESILITLLVDCRASAMLGFTFLRDKVARPES